MLPLRSTKLYRVDTQEDVARFYEWLAQPRDVLACDTETGGIDGRALQWYRPGFQLRLVQFGDCDSGWVLRADRFGAVIEDVLANYSGMFVGHNFIGFDVHALRACGFTIPPMAKIYDTLMMSRLHDPRGWHGLKDIATREFGSAAGAGQKLLDKAFELHGFGKDKGLGFSQIPYGTPAYDVYSAIDVVITARMFSVLWPKVQEFLPAYYNEMAAWWVTVEHEAKGLPVDLEFARTLKKEYEYKLVMVREELLSLGVTKPGSKTDRLQALYLEGFVPEEFTESGEVKLDKKTLETIATPTALALIEYGRIEKWLSAYIDKSVDSAVGGKVFPSYQPFGARTGRQSASNPPVQQLPGRSEDAYKIRGIFVARPGEELWSIDYDAEENRLLAHFSQDEALLKIIRDGLDIHRYTAAQIYDVDYGAVTSEQRNISKTYQYASAYGAGIKRLAKGLSLPQDEVRMIREKTNAAFGGVKDWKTRVEVDAKQRYASGEGPWGLTWLGRKVFADEYEGFEPKFYVLSNYILQGSGSDVLKVALNRIAAAGFSRYILTPQHDEVIFSLPPGPEGVELANELARIMAFPTEFAVPMTCSPEFLGDRWKPHA